MYIVKAGVDPLWEMAHAAKTAIKLMDGLGNSTPSDDFKSMATKIEMFVTRMVKFISQDRWRKIPALAPYDVVCTAGELGDNDVVLSTDGNGNIVYHEFTTIADWLEASYEQGGLTTGRNFERLIRLLETIEDNRIMEAIRAKDRATAKKIVRKMEERAKKRAVVKIVKTTKPLGTFGPVGRPPKDSEKVTKIENGHIKISEHGPNTHVRRLGKIKRDHPELAERIMAGEFKSVSEAERAAGLRKPLLTDYEKAQRAFWRLTEEEQERFREWLK